MPENLLVITEGDIQGTSGIAEMFLRTMSADGREYSRLAGLSSPVPSKTGIHLPAGKFISIQAGHIEPPGPGTAVLVLTEPRYWFAMSRLQKMRFDALYGYLLSENIADGALERCLLLLCSTETSVAPFRKAVEDWERFCSAANIGEKDLLLSSWISAFP